MANRRIALAAGFTAGHIFPMLAVAEAFRAHHPNAEILAIGGHDGPEAALISGGICDFHAIAGAPLHGLADWRDRLRALPALCRGFFQARRLLRESGSEMVIGFGAYISVGTLLAARSLGIPTAIFEPNAVPGLANRLLARLVDLKLLVFPAVAARPAFADARFVDYPLRREIAALGDSAPRARERRAPLRILITGGSRGSDFLNGACPDLCAGFAARGIALKIHHQSGDGDRAAIAAAYAERNLPAVVTGFVGNMAKAYAEADLIVCAAGAGTLSEIVHLGLPALIVPIEGLADDHQNANAAAFRSAGLHLVRREGDWQAGALADDILALLQDDRRRAAVGKAAGSFDIVSLCERLLAERGVPRQAGAVTASPSESAKS
jgi:UDP-N-acetylglucosamine--N-acetylmuramyl-(pentapeptide) pyrophosphoryl-undecaprenol N-acetylglucosamine transferase